MMSVLTVAVLAMTVDAWTVAGAAQARTPFDGIGALLAVGTIDPASIAVNIACPDGDQGTRMSGSLRSDVIGTGTYTLCLDAQVGPHQAWTPGTLVFSEDDGVSTLTLSVSAMRMSNYQATATFLGTYELNLKAAPTGRFAGHLVGGSGLLELSRPSGLILLTGALRSN